MQHPSSEIRTRSVPNCELCGTRGQILYENLADILFGSSGRWTLKKCPDLNCGLLWLDPVPLIEDIHLAYQQYFTHGATDGNAQSGFRFREVLYRAYRGLNWVTAALLGGKESKCQMANMFLDGIQPGKLLDVGCGDGKFLNRMRGRGWVVDGIDFDPKAIANARIRYGLELRIGDLHSAAFPDGTFEAVTLSHVIEHVPNPIGLLEEVRRILKPNGRIVVTTPNSGSFGHDKYQAHWFGLDPPRHLQVFSVNTLRNCALRAGIRVLESTSSAANADIFLGASESIAVAATRSGNSRPGTGINILRGIRALRGQRREFRELRSNPAKGEEAILIGTT